MLTEPVAVATALYNNSILVEQSTSTGAANGVTEDKADSDKEVSVGDDTKSEVIVRSYLAMKIQTADKQKQDSPCSPIDDSRTVITPTPSLLSFLNGYQNVLFRRGSPTLDSSRSQMPSLPGSLASSRKGSGILTPTKIEGGDTRLYPLSTILIIGLISFLLGSLVRSLLTPADFIYLSKDLGELEDGHEGWRELKRLVEFQYAVGGWDLVVGVVRRH